MEEVEIPTEHLQEEIHHHAQGAAQSWIMGVALTSALLAVLAAVSALMSGHHANEAMLEQMKASDAWSYYQAKGIKAAVLGSRIDFHRALKQPVASRDEEKLVQYEEEQTKISGEAKELEVSSRRHLRTHETFAGAVTLFQVAIGIAAIAALTRKRRFWLVSMGFGAAGLIIFVLGFLK
jgi:VIT1/CCC1 family predicted Fe2+/Mn2+ transporter